MNKERFEISVNQEDVQNIINCYEKDIEYIKELEDRINKAIEYINKCVEAQLEEDFLMNRVHLMNYNCNLLDLLKGDKE